MGVIQTQADQTYRDKSSPGSAVDHDPVKSEIRSLFGTVESRVDAAIEGASGAYIIKDTVEDLNDDLAHAGGTYARVIADDQSPPENGYYLKSGGSGSGSWAFVTEDPAVESAEEAAASAEAAEVAAAQAVDLVGRVEWAVIEQTTWDSEAIVGSGLTSVSLNSVSVVFSGFGTIIEPYALTVNAFYLPFIRQATGGGGAVVPWSKLRLYARTGASGTADNAGATVVAYGEIDLDPDVAAYSDVWVPMRDIATGELIDVEAADWGAEIGLFYQALTAGDGWASVDETRGTRTDFVTPERAYYTTTQNAQTDAWALVTPSPDHIGIQLGYLTGLAEGYAASPELIEDVQSSSEPPALTALAGDRDTPEERVGNALNSYGVVKGGPWMGSRLRTLKSRLLMLDRAQLTTIDIGMFGDSWTNNSAYFLEYLAQTIIDRFGDAGPGWFGFGALSGAIIGNARSAKYPTTRTGTWAGDYGNLPGVSNGPDCSNAKSSAAGARYTLTLTGGVNVSSATLFWEGTPDGVVRHRADGGAWTTRNVQGVNEQRAVLAGVTGSITTIDIEVVSGSVNLHGLNVLTAAPGVRFHKLACSGSMASQFALSDPTRWAASLAALSLKAGIVMWGTNESASSILPPVMQTALENVLDVVKVGVNGGDMGVMIPPENDGTPTYPMTDYAVAASAAAEIKGAAFLDLQEWFGSTVSEYDWTSARQLLGPDGYHPVVATTVPTIPTAIMDWFGLPLSA